MKHPKTALVATALGAVAIVGACGGDNGDQTTEISSGLAIEHVSVVNARDGTISAPATVVIENGVIQRVLTTPVRIDGTAQSIDGSGKYVVPGYLDMHTHVLDSPTNEQPYVGRLLVANGITGIREMRGSPDLVQSARQFNADVASGKLIGPEILTISGATIGLNAPPAAAVSASAAVAEVQAQKAYGAGFIKTVNANRAASFAFLAEAKNQGLYVAGHLNPSITAREASDAGWRAVEHLGSGMGVLLGCSTQEDAVRTTLLGGQGVVPPPDPPSWSANALNAPLYQTVFDTYDAPKCQTLSQAFAKNGTWQAPTLIRLRTQRFVEDQTYRTDPNLKYVSAATRATWEAAAVRSTTTLPPGAVATYHRYFDHELALPLLFKQNNVRLLAGSDTSVIAPWVIPGFSLHQEFALLASGGLSPLDVLQMTTLNGAQFVGRDTTMGTVEPGRVADLVLLDANPLSSSANLDRIAAVFTKGKYLPRATLDQMLSDVAKFYATTTTATAAFAAGVVAHDD